MPDGFGKAKYINSKFTTNFGRQSGWFSTKKDEYVGYWINGNPSGWGNLTYLDGSYFSGQWDEGKQSGLNSLYCFAHDSCINGVFNENGPNFGTWTNYSGVGNYNGFLSDFKPNAWGTLKFHNGDEYTGKV